MIVIIFHILLLLSQFDLLKQKKHIYIFCKLRAIIKLSYFTFIVLYKIYTVSAKI